MNPSHDTLTLTMSDFTVNDSEIPRASHNQVEQISIITQADLREQWNLDTSLLCRIPTEILANILLHLRYNAYQTRHDKEIQAYRVRHIVAWSVHSVAICRRIRSVALQTPELWSIIELGKTNIQRLELWLDLYLSRSGTCPLTLRINLPGMKFMSHKSGQSQCPDIDKVAIRTRDLTLINCSSAHVFECEFFTGSRYLWPVLQHFSMLHTRCRIDYIPAPLHDLYMGWVLDESCANLVSVHLMGEHSVKHLPHLPRLEDLQVEHMDFSSGGPSLRRVLQNSAGLRNLRLEDMSYPGHPFGQVPFPDLGNQSRSENLRLFPLPHLRTIRISGDVPLIQHLLHILPDPHEELSTLVGKRYRLESPNRIMRLITSMIARLRQYQTHNAQPMQYRAVIDLQPKRDVYIPVDEQAEPFVTFGPIRTHYQARSSIYRRVIFTGPCKCKALSLILGYTDTVEMGTYTNFRVIVDADQQAYEEHSHSRIKNIHFSEWSPELTQIQLVEEYLRWRLVSEPPNQVKSISVDARSWKDIPLDLAKRWMREGLVGIVVRKIARSSGEQSF